MERLRGRISGPLLDRIERSKTSEISSTAAHLAAFLDSDPVFIDVLGRLMEPSTCGKDHESATKNKADGNKAFQRRDYKEALHLYSQALRLMPCNPTFYSELATILTNRAATLHRLGSKLGGIRDCDRAIVINDSYAKAWYRRGMIRAELHQHEEALSDMEAAYAREKTTAGKKQVELELRQIQHKLAVASSSSQTVRGDLCTNSKPDTSFQTEVYWSSEKQWGLRTTAEVQHGTLVHVEDAIAAVILKEHRSTHCHGCFDVLPPDSVPCTGCAVAVYCNEVCQDNARVEHDTECGGSGWASVLPEEAILAGRTLILNSQIELCHHFDELPSHRRVEVYILAATLAKCLNCRRSIYPSKDLIAKLVLLLAMLQYNAMGVIHIHSSDEVLKANICGIEHVVVAQALFLGASKFNHSCSPNVHVSYHKRSLRAYSTIPLPAFSPLEISYGMQVGKSERTERKRWLKERYVFECCCDSCRLGTAADFLQIAYRCCQPGCQGIVFDPDASVDSLRLPRSSDAVSFLTEHHILPQDDMSSISVPARRCLTCKTPQSVKDAARKSLKELKNCVCNGTSGDNFLPNAIVDGLKLLGDGRKFFHPFNKQLAQMEDDIARIYSEAQQPAAALVHSQKSLEILEVIYGSKDIALAYERVKLASIAQAAGLNKIASESLVMADRTFSVYYGSEYERLFPKLKNLVLQHPA